MKEKHVRTGDIIRVMVNDYLENNRVEKREVSYRVVRRYTHHVLCVDKRTGTRRCFCTGDLIQMGLETQAPELEAQRRE